MSKSVLPMFSSGSFIVSGLTYRSLILFEFIFVHDVKECSLDCLVVVVFFCFFFLATPAAGGSSQAWD